MNIANVCTASMLKRIYGAKEWENIINERRRCANCVLLIAFFEMNYRSSFLRWAFFSVSGDRVERVGRKIRTKYLISFWINFLSHLSLWIKFEVEKVLDEFCASVDMVLSCWAIHLRRNITIMSLLVKFPSFRRRREVLMHSPIGVHWKFNFQMKYSVII